MKTVEPFTPIQYVMGSAEFCGLDLAVDERVLIPRPETEILVKTALDTIYAIRNTHDAIRILDLCTGSGNIAISLTKSVSDCKIVASDISDGALDVARRNASRHGVSENIEFVNSDLFNNISGKFDIIVSNPPYIARHEFAELQEEVLKEPAIALDGGDDGLDFYRKITADAHRYLKAGGYLIFEIGFGQLAAIKEIAKFNGALKFIESRKDLNGIDRVVTLQFNDK